MIWVAQITEDKIWRRTDPFESKKDKLFSKEACEDWWGWEDPWDSNELPETNTAFKLYDDDGEHYYSGWLHNDDECIVQQFVLAWAQNDSGCTTITVHNGIEYVQEIG